jgi:GPI mannosyltransferase 3
VVTTRAFLLYISLCVFRTANALLIQTQFDPDEYWQTLEPAYCEAFSQCAYTWEWTRRADDGPWWMRSMEGPIRSYLSIVPTYIFYIVAKRWRWDSLMWVVPKGPLIVHAVVVAAPTDLATWYMGQWNASSKDITVRRRLSACCLLCSVTSWFNGYALVRTYSNSLEDMLLSVGIALVSPVGDDRGYCYDPCLTALLCNCISLADRNFLEIRRDQKVIFGRPLHLSSEA